MPYYGITQYYLLPTRQRWESRLYPQPKEVLGLATSEGCKAELTVDSMLRESGSAGIWTHDLSVASPAPYRRLYAAAELRGIAAQAIIHNVPGYIEPIKWWLQTWN